MKFIVPTDSKHNSDINAKLDFELSYKVAKTGDTEVKRITKNITIPKLKRAVVVVPGIMGIDLAKHQMMKVYGDLGLNSQVTLMMLKNSQCVPVAQMRLLR